MGKDYYKILHLTKVASSQEIKAAYKELAKKYHPDNNIGDNKSLERFKDINEAYATLSDPERKKQYEMEYGFSGVTGHGQNQYSRECDVNSIFKDEKEAYYKALGEYLDFLDEMEPKFERYGQNLDVEKKEALEFLDWSIISISFEAKKLQVKQKYEKILRKVRAFDDFQDFYKKCNEELEILGEYLLNIDEKYLKQENRGLIEESTIYKLKNKLKVSILNIKRTKLKEIIKMLEARNINSDIYLYGRNIYKFDITAHNIKELINIIDLIDEISTKLAPLNMSIDEYLAKRKMKHLVDLNYNELEALCKSIDDIDKSNENVIDDEKEATKVTKQDETISATKIKMTFVNEKCFNTLQEGKEPKNNKRFKLDRKGIYGFMIVTLSLSLIIAILNAIKVKDTNVRDEVFQKKYESVSRAPILNKIRAKIWNGYNNYTIQPSQYDDLLEEIYNIKSNESVEKGKSR